MIIGVGVDTVEVSRFERWHKYSYQQLARIFSDDEITYCMSVQSKSAERLCARFAAKEALLKALTAAGIALPLLYICKHSAVIKHQKNNNPVITLSNELAQLMPKNYKIHASLTHSQQHATAFVVIELC